MRGRLVWVRGGMGGSLHPLFLLPAPFPPCIPMSPPHLLLTPPPQYSPAPCFTSPQPKTTSGLQSTNSPYPQKNRGTRGPQCCALLKRNWGSGGSQCCAPLKTWGLWGVPHALPLHPISPSGLGRIGQSHPGAPVPPVPRAAPSHSKQPLCALSPPRCSWSLGPPRPPRSSVVLCCSFRCL